MKKKAIIGFILVIIAFTINNQFYKKKIFINNAFSVGNMEIKKINVKIPKNIQQTEIIKSGNYLDISYRSLFKDYNLNLRFKNPQNDTILKFGNKSDYYLTKKVVLFTKYYNDIFSPHENSFQIEFKKNENKLFLKGDVYNNKNNKINICGEIKLP